MAIASGLDKEGMCIMVPPGTTAHDDALKKRIAELESELSTLRASEAELQQKIAHCQALLTAIPDLVLCLGCDGRYLSYIPGAGFDTPSGEVIGKHVSEVLPPDEARQRLHYTQRAIETREVQVYESRMEVSGELRHFEARTVALDGGSALTIVRDVTEVRQRNEQLRQAQKMEVIGRLAAGVAHDFGNLLTALIGYAELARPRARGNNELLEALDSIDQVAQRGRVLTSSLLMLSRKAEPQMRVVDLAAAVLESIRVLGPLMPSSIGLVHQPSEESMSVWADPTQIQQLLLNLVINARDAMPRGGEIRITLHRESLRSVDQWQTIVRREAGVAVLTVEDTGIGMPDNVKNRLFDAFFTTKEGRGGTGLGMTIVKDIVDAHAGEIDIESAEDRGTRIRVALPCHVGHDAADDTEPRPREVTGRGETILLADAEPHVRSVMAKALERAGFRVFEAADGDEVVRAYADYGSQVRLVILDVDLPGKQGPACLSELRTRGEVIPAILVGSLFVGASDEELPPKTRFLLKPFRMVALLEAVGDLLNED
jgi:two-component system cell cycle sensor histidine kinase/response regulator CckA